jgi:hypothetical protein
MFIVFGPLWFVIIVYIIHLTYKNKAHRLEETLTNIAGVIIISMLFLGLGALIVHGVKTIDKNNKEIEKIKHEMSQIEKNYGVIPGGWNDLSTMNK